MKGSIKYFLVAILICFPLLFVSSYEDWLLVALPTSSILFISSLSQNDKFFIKILAILFFSLFYLYGFGLITMVLQDSASNLSTTPFEQLSNLIFQIFKHHWAPLLNINWISDFIKTNTMTLTTQIIALIGVYKLFVFYTEKSHNNSNTPEKEEIHSKFNLSKYAPLFVLGFAFFSAYLYISVQPPQIMPLSTEIAPQSFTINNLTIIMQFITFPFVVKTIIPLILIILYFLYSFVDFSWKISKRLILPIGIIYAYAFLYLNAGGTQLPANEDNALYTLVKNNPKLIEVLPNYVNDSCNMTVGNYNAFSALATYPNADDFMKTLKVHMPKDRVIEMCSNTIFKNDKYQ